MRAAKNTKLCDFNSLKEKMCRMVLRVSVRSLKG